MLQYLTGHHDLEPPERKSRKRIDDGVKPLMTLITSSTGASVMPTSLRSAVGSRVLRSPPHAW